MASPHRQTVDQRRISALESRVSDIEEHFGDTLYRLERRTVANELALTAVLEHLGLPPITPSQIDAVLDES